MFGTTLRDIRRHVETLASEDGEFYLVCARTGERPIPAAGKWFADRALARTGARATEQYRMALRRYDPRLPYHDVIVCQAGGGGADARTAAVQESPVSTDPPTAPEPPPDSKTPLDRDWERATDPRPDGRADGRDAPREGARDPTSPPERGRRIEYCHAVASAVFETLAETGHEAVERAVMDTYLDLAESVSDPDRLCVCLLECMATALDEHLTHGEQAGVLARSAARLEPGPAGDAPVMATVRRLQRVGLLGTYARSPWSVDAADGTRSVVVRLTGYELAPRNDRLPVLPIVVDCYRCESAWVPASVRVEETADGWRVTLALARCADPADGADGDGPADDRAADDDATRVVDPVDGDGLAAVPIRSRR